jgi:hypothetical protein
LRRSEHNVELPVVEAYLFGSDAADAIDNNQCLWADLVDELAKCLDLAEHTGAGVYMCDGQDLVLLLLQRSLDLVQLGAFANRGLELRRLHTICLEAVGERICKVPSVQHEHFVAGLGKVCGNLVPPQCTGTGNNEGLGGGVGGLEELAQVG